MAAAKRWWARQDQQSSPNAFKSRYLATRCELYTNRSTNGPNASRKHRAANSGIAKRVVIGLISVNKMELAGDI
jgi:hypothetical protein